MDIEIKKADITYLKDIQNLNNQLFELEYNNFDPALKVGWTFEEKEIVAKNIYNVLNKHNGVWITCDVTPKGFIQKQNNFMPDFNNNLSIVTSRNNLTDRFKDIEHINKFMKNIGFKRVEIHKFNEVKDELSSFDILGIDKNSADEVLDSAIVAVIKI